MRLATTTGDFDGHCKTYLEKIQCVHEAGFRYIDLSLCSTADGDPLLTEDNWQDTAAELKAYAEANGIQFVQSHGPCFNPVNSNENLERAIRITTRAIEVCGYLGIPNTVIHCGSDPKLTKEEWFIKAREFFRALIPALEKHNVVALHENGTSKNTPWYTTKNGKDMREFSEFVDHPLVHSCWDTGHANLEGPQYDEILAMGDDLMALHIADNRGEGDEHILPMMGTLNLDEVMHALRDIGYKGCFTFEGSWALRPHRLWLGDRHPFPRDTRLLRPTLPLQKEMEKFMYALGEYILKTYDEFEP